MAQQWRYFTLVKKDTREKYLKQYACSEAQEHAQAFISKNVTAYFSHVLIIPAYNESSAFIRRLEQTPFTQCQKLLVIIIVNQSDHFADATRLNKRLIHYSTSIAGNIEKTPPVHYLPVYKTIPSKEGVGYARKLGCDIALTLMQEGHIAWGWLHCTDADATLPINYFLVPKPDDKKSALTYQFKHTFHTAFTHSKMSWAQNKIERTTVRYEESLRYYEAGLAYAQSPYAYPTIGSCLAINPEYYAQARGFPRRSAGEDFYLLNKLAKLAVIVTAAPTIILKPRASQRVPFGTGPAIQKQYSCTVYLDYDPAVFQALRTWLQEMPKLYNAIQNTSSTSLSTLIKAQHIHIESVSYQALFSLDVDKLLSHIQKQAKHCEQALRMSHEWFDAFRTLKFIHFLTNHAYPKKDASEVYAECRWLK